MAGMPPGLLDHVGKRPAHRGTVVTLDRPWCRRLKVVARGNDVIRPCSRVLTGSDESVEGLVGRA